MKTIWLLLVAALAIEVSFPTLLVPWLTSSGGYFCSGATGAGVFGWILAIAFVVAFGVSIVAGGLALYPRIGVDGSVGCFLALLLGIAAPVVWLGIGLHLCPLTS
jgi:hypothetical protein